MDSKLIKAWCRHK